MPKFTRLPTMLLAAFASIMLVSCADTQDSNDNALLGAPETAGEWPRPGRDMGDSYFSPLSGFTASNVDQLGLAFEFTDFLVRGDVHYGLQSTPVMIDGKLIFSGPWGEAYALDARTGEVLWTHDSAADGQYARNTCCGVVNRGVAISDDTVFVGGLDGHLFALDINSGEQVWKADTFYDRKWNYSLTGAPQIAGDVVIIGNAGADMGARGYVSAYDLKTGELAWRFWSVPGNPETEPDETPEVTMARETWAEDTRWELGLGGTAWNGLAYDAATNTAYLGIGNGGPHPAWLRSESGEMGDNLYLSSIVAVDADTGRLKWHYQETPGDSWDYTATAPMVLADIEIDGQIRNVIMQAPKNGLFYVLDRNSGELLKADPFTRVNWTTGVDMKTGRPTINPDVDYRDGPKLVWPSGAGAHGWQPMAFSPRTGFVYIPVYDAGMDQSAPDRAGFIPGNINQASVGGFPPFSEERLDGREQGKFEGRLKAWDPVAGKARWISDELPFLNGGTMVAGDLVFQGTSSGHLDAYDAETGKRVMHLFLGSIITASPMVYELDGVQYLAILAGAGGPQGAFFGPGVVAAERENYQRLIVLKLDGDAIALPAERTSVKPSPMPEKIAASAATLALGEELFLDRCSRCHVVGGALAVYPNLWNMQPAQINAFHAIVSDGAMAYSGMGAFSDQLNTGEIDAIKAFIITDIIATRQGAGIEDRERSRQTH